MIASPTRAQIEVLLSSVPVGKSKGTRTVEKKTARNVKRREKVQAFLSEKYPDPRVVQLIMNDLESYVGYESETEDV